MATVTLHNPTCKLIFFHVALSVAAKCWPLWSPPTTRPNDSHYQSNEMEGVFY
jgi:hypothetical protein